MEISLDIQTKIVVSVSKGNIKFTYSLFFHWKLPSNITLFEFLMIRRVAIVDLFSRVLSCFLEQYFWWELYLVYMILVTLAFGELLHECIAAKANWPILSQVSSFRIFLPALFPLNWNEFKIDDDDFEEFVAESNSFNFFWNLKHIYAILNFVSFSTKLI